MMKYVIFCSLALFLSSIRGYSQDKSKELDLKSQLILELESIVETYAEDNHGFIYSILENDTVILQVVHSSFVEEIQTEKNEFGLTIALSFDYTFDDESQNHQKFKSTKYFSRFTGYSWEEIPCYGLDMKLNVEETIEILLNILEEVYMFNSSTNFFTSFNDQGPILE